MSFTDEIYINKEGKADIEAAATQLGEWTDAADLPFGAQKLLLSALAADIVLMGLTLFGLNYVRIFLDFAHLIAYGLLAAFAIGLLIPFAAYKIFKNDISPDEPVHIDTGVMSGYMDEENSHRQFAAWYLAAGGAILNSVMWLFVPITHF